MFYAPKRKWERGEVLDSSLYPHFPVPYGTIPDL